MAQLKTFFKKIVVLVIMISIVMGSCAVPNSYAKLTIQDGEFYYAGTTKGSYVPSDGIFSWLFDFLAQIAEFLLTLIPNILRMAFVGYAAGAEKLLTWVVESTAGVNLQGEDMNATDLTALSDSSNNVTVQAIVYNMVPAFDVNFFENTEKKDLYIKTIKERDADGNLKDKDVVISPTGQQLICKKCEKSADKCCGDVNTTDKEVKCYGNCGCNGCDACKKYAELMIATDPIIIQLKTLIAVWYYLIRLLAVAAMAVVLVAIGIKMAISTVASDKAVYKRMLVDWVTGVILIFTMHYIMLFAITINEILVNTVRESANAVNKVQLAQLSDTKNGSGNSKDKEVEKSNQDIEIDVYEEIRTRAYDPKMTVGLMGMIMYFAMVFMAFKYTIIYVKRFLTLAVLTLMAPGLGVAYALQKVLSGKSSSLKTWFTEYILNLFIQVVHALIYAIFISAALAYSLENVSGVILALILMNFSLKAEGIFRRIFNIDPGNKGLLGSTESAADNLKKSVNTAKGLYMGAKPVAKALTFPARAAFGGAAKTAAAGGLMAGSLAAKGASVLAQKASPTVEKVMKSASDKAESINQGNGVVGKIYSAGKTITKPVTVAGKFFRKKGKSSKDEFKELAKANEVDLQNELNKAISKYQKDPDNKQNARDVLEANRRLEKHREIVASKTKGITAGTVAVGHIKAMFDMNNYFDVKISKNGKKYYTMKSGVVFGKYKYNSSTGKFEKDTSNAAYTQFGASKLLGFTAQDKKLFKEQIMNPIRNSAAGMVAMFAGMGTLTSHPVVAMGMISGGALATTGMVKKFHRSKEGPNRLKLRKDRNKSRYKFGSFTSPAMITIRDNVVMQANRDLSKHLLSEVNRRHPTFKEKMKNDLITPKTIIPTAAGLAVGFVSLPAGLLTAGILRKTMSPSISTAKQDPLNEEYENIYDPYGYEADAAAVKLHPVGNSALDIIDAHHFSQLKKQRDKFDEETGDLMTSQIINDGATKLSMNMRKLDKSLDAMSDDDISALQVAFAMQLGKDYDPKTGLTQSQTADLDVDKRDLVKEIEVTGKDGKTTTREITDKDIENVNKALNNAISARVAKSIERAETIDVNDETMLFEIIDEVSAQPEIKQLLSSDQGVEVLFKGNMSALKSTIKDKAASANTLAKNEIAQNLNLNGEELDVVKEAIVEVATESAGKDGSVDMSTLDQEKIFAKIQTKISGETPKQQPKQQSKQKNSKTDKVNTDVDQLLSKSKEITYKNAISTLLTPDATKIQNNKQLKVNVKTQSAKSKIDSILNLQTGADPLQIRDRVTNANAISKSVKVERKTSREETKKTVKKQMVDILDKYSEDTNTTATKPEDKMTAKEKLAQAKAATESLLAFAGDSKEVNDARDSLLNSLFAVSNTQQQLRELNEYAQENFSEKTKFKKKKSQKYLQAEIDASVARAEKSKFEMQELQTGTAGNPDEKKKKQRQVILSEEALNSMGPVKDAVKASKDIIAEMRKKRL